MLTSTKPTIPRCQLQVPVSESASASASASTSSSSSAPVPASFQDNRKGNHKVKAKVKKDKSESPTFTKFLTNILRKALGHGSSPPMPPRDASYNHGNDASRASQATVMAPPDSAPVPTQVPTAPYRDPQQLTATTDLTLLSAIHVTTLFSNAAQAFDSAATRLIACYEPALPDPSAAAAPRLWHTLALHLRATFPTDLRHLLRPVLTPLDLVPYLSSLLSELALDVCQTLVPGGPLSADQAHASHVLATLDTDTHVRATLDMLVDDLLRTLSAMHPHPLPIDADDQAALRAACVAATRALAGMRAVDPNCVLDSPLAHAPLPATAAPEGVVWVGVDVSRDVMPGGRKAVADATRVAYVVFPGVLTPTKLPAEAVPPPLVAAYHDPNVYLACRKRDLYAAAMAAKAQANAEGQQGGKSELEVAMMQHWHALQQGCEDEGELERQRRRAAEDETMLANAYAAHMGLVVADAVLDG